MAQKFWWADAWYDKRDLEAPQNHAVIERQLSYINSEDGTEVPAILYRPETPGEFPGVLFQHGRRGLDPFVQRLARRMAARGFDFRSPDMRTFADDLATRDCNQRAAAFMRKHLQ